uniref:Uncharacterized protein n=1 Tax=Tulasnella barnavirus 1 TaxID=2768768 RepID=A0A7G9U7U6_9VIRU|nr:hypothetical protein [Tulasnella barnavirus 1]
MARTRSAKSRASRSSRRSQNTTRQRNNVPRTIQNTDLANIRSRTFTAMASTAHSSQYTRISIHGTQFPVLANHISDCVQWRILSCFATYTPLVGPDNHTRISIRLSPDADAWNATDFMANITRGGNNKLARQSFSTPVMGKVETLSASSAAGGRVHIHLSGGPTATGAHIDIGYIQLTMTIQCIGHK